MLDGRSCGRILTGNPIAHAWSAVHELSSDGALEMAVITREDHRGQGMTRIVCARTILACERIGHRTRWNTSLENVGSAGLARSLGYRSERRHRTLVWAQDRLSLAHPSALAFSG